MEVCLSMCVGEGVARLCACVKQYNTGECVQADMA